MYFIDRNEDRPDLEYLKFRLRQSVEERGIQLSVSIDELREELAEEKSNLLSYFKRDYHVANPNSPKQIKEWMEKNFAGAEIEMCTLDSGELSSSKDYLINVAHGGNKFAIDILTYRKINKRLEYVDLMLKHSDIDRIIRPTVSIGNTNRVNYSDPPLMNIPKSILWKVVSPNKRGNVLISVDIKNQEPWVLINWLGISVLKRMIEDNPLGLYNAIYEKVYGSEPNKIERDECKTAWNALTYGVSKYGISRICKNIDGDKIRNFFNKIEELDKYKKLCYAMAANRQKLVKTYFGTVLHIPGGTTSQIQRRLLDFGIQGTGSDILALLVEHLDDELTRRKLTDKLSLCYSRHDELILEVDGEYYKQMKRTAIENMIKDILEHKIDDWTPFRIEISVIGEDGEMLDDEEEE